jgi:hypothetical protein
MIIHEDSKFVVIATGKGGKSNNRKTGEMIQLWILLRAMSPKESKRLGIDAIAQCAGCPLASNQGCYVDPRALASIWATYERGGYAPLVHGTVEFTEFFRGEKVRFGAYGNPSLIPLPLVSEIALLAECHTGYFHDWNLMPADRARAYGAFFMASCEPSNFAQAQAIGLRTFTTCAEAGALPKEAGVECLSETKGMTCAECGLCDGTQRSAKRSKPLPSVWIKVHGFQVKKASASISV